MQQVSLYQSSTASRHLYLQYVKLKLWPKCWNPELYPVAYPQPVESDQIFDPMYTG